MALSHVQITKQPDGSFQYLVDSQPRPFIGMGYNPIYRNLSDHERIGNYERDFQILHDAGVNTITGWDADKGYEQDKFDELTLAVAQERNIGVVMPLNLSPEGDYNDAALVQGLLDEARGKGVGLALLRFLEEEARRRGAKRLTLNAQVSAREFYEKAGYQAGGAIFDDAGIPHVPMDRPA